METTILIIVLILFIVVQFGINIYDRRTSQKREQDLIAALLAKNLSEYALANTQIRTTTRERIKQIRAENELALANEKILESSTEQGIPVT